MSDIKKIIQEIVDRAKGTNADPILLEYTTYSYIHGNLSKELYLQSLDMFYNADNLYILALIDAINTEKESKQ